MPDGENVGALVVAARAGDRDAWNALVDRFSGLIWSVVRGHRLSPADGADVIQTTWLRLVENLDRIDAPERVGAWLATTARRECLRTLARSQRVRPTEDEFLDVDPVPFTGDAALLRDERDSALWAAFGQISESCQELLRLLMTDPPLPYEEVAEILGRPVGAIGPTRGRCLERLRAKAEQLGITREGDGS